MKRPSRFANASIRIRAIVMSNLIEHTSLVDDACPARGISLWVPHELDDSADVQELRSALKTQWTFGTRMTLLRQFFEVSRLPVAQDVSRSTRQTTPTISVTSVEDMDEDFQVTARWFGIGWRGNSRSFSKTDSSTGASI